MDAEQISGRFGHPGIEWRRLQMNTRGKTVSDDAECSQPGKGLVIGRYYIPGSPFCRCRFNHVLDGGLILRPTCAISEVFIGKFPTLQWIGEARLESV